MAKQSVKGGVFAALSISLTLGACSSSGFGGSSQAPNSAMSAMASDLQAAYCNGRGTDIVDALRGEPLASPADQFYLAISLEQTGQVLGARDIYTELAKRRDAGSINVACGGTRVISGSIAEEALAKLTRLSVKLADYDIRLGPPIKMHDGLPKREDDGSQKSVARPQGPTEPDPSIAAPTSASSAGLFFAHLTSYRSEENIATGIAQLTRFYPGLSGVLGSWETASPSGPIWRVGVRTIDFNDAETLCTQIERGGAYCRVLDTTQ